MAGFKYKPGDDAITIVARAIREYFNGDEDKIKAFHSRQMAEIITGTFLDDTISETSNLIKQNKATLNDLEALVRNKRYEVMTKQSEINRLTTQVEKLTKAKADLEQTIRAHNGEKTGAVETDSALAGAKKAYDWIYQKTRNAEIAAKSFNSYLIGGRYKDGETYDDDIQSVDANAIIRDATITRL